MSPTARKKRTPKPVPPAPSGFEPFLAERRPQLAADAQRLPKFIIIGAMKCGTTSMRHILVQHPQVFLPQGDVCFFDLDRSFDEAVFPGPSIKLIQSLPAAHTIVQGKVIYVHPYKSISKIHVYAPAKIERILKRLITMIQGISDAVF